MIIDNLDQMKKFAKKFAQTLKIGDVVRLKGDLASGKTTFVSFVGEYFSFYNTSSPSFALVNIYDGDVRIYHLDLYRFENEDEILDIDFERYFYPDDGISFIERAEKAQSYLPDNMIEIDFKKIDENKREVKIKGGSYENFSY